MQVSDTSDPATPTCWSCGEPEVLEIAEIWTDHTFALDTCCPGLVERVAADMADDPTWGATYCAGSASSC